MGRSVDFDHLQHIQARAKELRIGETVLAAGTILRPQEIGLLATAGRDPAPAIPAPEVAILSTGDELVEAGMRPGSGQIRNSNGPMLVACVTRGVGRGSSWRMV